MKAKLLFLYLGILTLFVSLFTGGGGLVVAQSDPFNVGPVRYGDFKVTGTLTSASEVTTSLTVSGTVDGTSLKSSVPIQADISAVVSPSMLGGYSFDGDDDTGVNRSAANSIGFVAGGNLIAAINGNGLGVGDVTPNSRIDVDTGVTWETTAYAVAIDNNDTTATEGNGLLVEGGAGSSSSNIARFNTGSGTRVFSIGGAGQVSVSPSGNLNVADAGGNGGNVPHECAVAQQTSSAVLTLDSACGASQIATGGGCSAGSGNTITATRPTLSSTTPTGWRCTQSAATGTINTYAICCNY